MSEHRAGYRFPSASSQPTVAEVADARQAGYDDGYQEGLAKGYEEGKAKAAADAQRQLDVELTQIRQLVQAMHRPFSDFKTSILQSLNHLCVQVCETFLRHQLSGETALLHYLVEQSLSQLLPTDHQLTIFTNQHHRQVIEKALSQHLPSTAWRVQVNDRLAEGNIYLEAGHSTVNINLKNLLHEYLSHLDTGGEQ